MRKCKVFVKRIYAGELTETDQRDYTFDYDETYLLNDNYPAVSLTLPKKTAHFHSKKLFSFFFNMLSEGENRKRQSELLHIDEDDDFGILLETAQYDTPGCVTIEPM